MENQNIKEVLGVAAFYDASEKQGNTKTIGAIYNLTGAQASLDIPALKGFRLAFDQLQFSSHPYVKSLKLIEVDGKTNPDVIDQEAKQLYLLPEVLALIGINDYDMARSVAKEARANQKVFVTSGTTSPLLTQEFPKYSFLVAFGDNAQAAAAAEYALQTLRVKKSAILCNMAMRYARLIADYFYQSFTRDGGTIPVKDYYPHHGANIEAQIKKIKEARPEMVYLAAGPEETNLIKELRRAGITVPIFGGDSFDTPLMPIDLSDVYYTCHIFLDPNSHDQLIANFIKDYRKKYGENPNSSFAALGFDACNLFTAVLSEAGSYETEDLLKILNQIKFTGVTGEISYQSMSHTPVKPVTIASVIKGKKVEMAKFIPRAPPPT